LLERAGRNLERLKTIEEGLNLLLEGIGAGALARAFETDHQLLFELHPAVTLPADDQMFLDPGRNLRADVNALDVLVDVL
jgi:hypothetical protein